MFHIYLKIYWPYTIIVEENWEQNIAFRLEQVLPTFFLLAAHLVAFIGLIEVSSQGDNHIPLLSSSKNGKSLWISFNSYYTTILLSELRSFRANFSARYLILKTTNKIAYVILNNFSNSPSNRSVILYSNFLQFLHVFVDCWRAEASGIRIVIKNVLAFCEDFILFINTFFA